jgi:predicted PurR-regulated permease PerM
LTREQIVSIFLLLALGGFLVLVAQLLLPYAGPVAWAAVLAVVFSPAYGALRSLMPRSPNLSAGVMTLLVFSVVIVPSLLLTSILAREAIEGYQHLRDFLSTDRLDRFDSLTSHWMIAPVWNWIREQQESGDVNPTSMLLSVVRWASEQFGSSSRERPQSRATSSRFSSGWASCCSRCSSPFATGATSSAPQKSCCPWLRTTGAASSYASSRRSWPWFRG